MLLIKNNSSPLLRRYIAGFLDYFIYFLLIGIVFFLFGEETEFSSYTLRGNSTFLVPIVWVIYFSLIEGITGQTLAKKALDLHVLLISGKEIDLIQAFVRRILDPLELFFFGIPAVISINFSRNGQRFGDWISDTIVVHTGAKCKWCGVAVELSPKEAYKNTFTCPNCGKANSSEGASGDQESLIIENVSKSEDSV